MNPISNFLLESTDFCNQFKTPEALLDWMKDIEYGWCDKNGKKYIGSDYYGDIFWKDYRLLLPEEVYKKKIGVCWDQTIFEKYVFDRQFSYETKMIFIQQYKISTHTFLVYKTENEWLYFENSFNKYKGIHGPYKQISDIVKLVFKQMQEYEKGKDGYGWSFMDPNKFKKKLTCKQFMNYCGYNYEKMEETDRK